MTNLPQFVKLAPDGVYEYYMDHTLLSGARMCEARFELERIQLYTPRSKSWSLEFGSLFHSCMEFLYKRVIDDNFDLTEFLIYGGEQWRRGGFDNYATHPFYKTHYKALGGLPGFVALLAQYVAYYNTYKDNLKPIALEIPFGKAKEVPLLEDATLYKWAPFRLYLSGRMDFIFDDGRRIGPLDHKTFSIEGKNPITGYEVQEGMTGYVYAMAFLYQRLKEIHKEEEFKQRDTNVVWMNFVLTKSEADMNKRFQRIPLYKTKEQLEDYRLRQISTTAKIHQILIEGRTPDFNGSVCTNYWHQVCPFHQVHRLGSQREQQIILSKEFEQGKEWNPEHIIT